MKTQEETIQELVDNLDYHKIEAVMHFLGWTYGDKKHTPSITDIRKTARYIAEAVVNPDPRKKEWAYCSTGGFVGTRLGEWPECYVNLAFVVDDFDIHPSEEE